MRAFLVATALFALGVQATPSTDVAVLEAYVRAIGGEDAVRAVRTRITEGTFDNGRGLRAPFSIYEKAPNKCAIIISKHPIGSPDGSGRGYDGALGWDKNFIGTGLRSVEGSELEDLAQESDTLRPLHLTRDCRSTHVEPSGSTTILRCERASRPSVTLHFDTSSGLLVRQESEPSPGRGIAISLADYRSVDGVRLPFQTRFVGPGFTVTYVVERVRHNEPIDDRTFLRPSS